MGVDGHGLELGVRLPAREGLARRVEKEGHFRVEIALAQADVEARHARVVGVDIFEERMEYVVFGGRRG